MGEERSYCDLCVAAKAVVYCRADSARLCLSCDRQVHAANTVSSKHRRSLLCSACSSAPSALLCLSAPHCFLPLCSNCDFDAHSAAGLCNHDRRPLDPFEGYPSAVDLASVLGLGAVDEKEAEVWAGDDGDGCMWETTPVLSFEDLIVPTTSVHGFQALGISPLRKNRSMACGKHEEEILRQLRELIKSETYSSNDREVKPVFDFSSLVPQQNLQEGNLSYEPDQDTPFIFVPALEAHEASDTMAFSFEQFIERSSFIEESLLDGTTSPSVRDIEQPFVEEKLSSPLMKGGLELLCPDRDSVISRYKEKRKSRRYDKVIRYESRKARADCRMRIKGRFAKADKPRDS